MQERKIPQSLTPASAQPTPPAPHDAYDSVLFGRFGLRAVWGILIAIFLFILLHFVLNSARHAILHHNAAARHTQAQSASAAPATRAANEAFPQETLYEEGSVFLGILLIAWIMSRLEHRRLGVYGIGRNRRSDIVPGAMAGVATLSLLVATLRATHVLVFEGRALDLSAALRDGVLWLLVFLCVGLFEEYATRGYLQYTLTRGFFTLAERISPTHARALAFWSAAIVMSCLFGVAHLSNPGETAPGIAAVFLAGMVFSYALWRTGSLWWAIGFHMAWDWSQSFLYGVPDSGLVSAGRLWHTHPAGRPLLSGGTDGPEASLFILPTLLLVVLLIRFTARRGTQPALQPQTPLLDGPRETNSAIA